MQIQTLTVSEQQIGTIVSAIDDHNNLFLKNLHSHQELEIVYIRRGSGHLVMGDSVQTINEGDIIVIGTNVPHLWLTSHEEMNGKDKSENDQTPHIKRAALARITATSVQFSPDFAGSSLWDIHEMLPIKQIVYLNSATLFYKINLKH